MADLPELCVLVPIYNEERRLPDLLASLRAQSMPRLRVVLVDNGSTDGSAGVLASCPEVAAGRWIALREPRIGKFNALRTGNAFIAREIGSPLVAPVDADTRIDDRTWLERGVDVARRTGSAFGYAFCVHEYTGVDHLPRLAAAIRANEDAVAGIAAEGGWYTAGCCAVHPADLLAGYLERAVPAAEIDLRQSLYALQQRRRSVLVPGLIRSPSRRMIATRALLRRWSFYDRRYYRDRDINLVRKVDLERPETVEDLDQAAVERLFVGRGRKVACRNIVPLAIFDRAGRMLSWVADRVSPRALRSLLALRREFGSSEVYLTDRFEDLIRTIERRVAGLEISELVAAMIREHHALATRPARAAAAASSSAARIATGAVLAALSAG